MVSLLWQMYLFWTKASAKCPKCKCKCVQINIEKLMEMSSTTEIINPDRFLFVFFLLCRLVHMQRRKKQTLLRGHNQLKGSKGTSRKISWLVLKLNTGDSRLFSLSEFLYRFVWKDGLHGTDLGTQTLGEIEYHISFVVNSWLLKQIYVTSDLSNLHEIITWTDRNLTSTRSSSSFSRLYKL